MSEEQITPNNGSYSADSIQVLEGLEAVRKRPAMYIGDISIKGLHHLVYEIVDNSIDEALAGYCSHIEVTINEDNSITVQDNGRGIPVDYHEKEKKSALEVAMTVLHAGGKFDKGSYKVSGGLHGVGMSCVNALSTHMTTQVFRNGKIYQQEYEIGKPLYSVKEVGTADITGTRQQFWPDGSIFTETVYDYKILASRLRELAYLNAGLRISLTDRRVVNEDGSFKSEQFYSEEGLREFVRFIESSREHLINDVIYLNSEKQGIPIEVAIMYNTGFSENVHSYVNNINTIEGGTHLAGFRRVAYNSLEQGLSLSLQKAWERVDMAKAGSNIILLNKEELPELRARLSKRKSPDIIVIDSLQYLEGFTVRTLKNLKKDYPDKLFIFICHADKAGKDPDSKIGIKVRYDSDIKIRVEGYKAFVTTRYEDPDKGEGGADFVIWEQGAAEYWAEQIK